MKRRSIAVDAEALTAFQAACNSRSVTRPLSETASRLLQWFNRQEQLVQTAVIADVDAKMNRHYARALRKLADELDPVGATKPK